ncbi:MAG: homoserine dehydrogenase [Oscillospiraceae bacterium]|nr:homoserine dehydrogenase [Oscillospiraceae bacterium]
MKVAIMGYGVVGSGVAEVLKKNHESILKKSTLSQLDLKYILDIRDFPGDENESLLVRDFNLILNDSEVGIVVETMGGLRPAFDFVSACLRAGKHVVSSNKELVAEKGFELLKIAEEKNVNFLFEASVGGGIPIIRPLSQCLAANEIDEICGILNGTTNFILTKMINEGMDFESVLKMAQDNGYAEKDPTADIEGFDACRKICILASLVYGKHVYPEEVHTEGITRISIADVEYARDFGGVIKLIARAKKLDENKIFAMVSPMLVPGESQLSTVDDVFNGILVKGDSIGDVVFYGRGAGKLPTASAVVGDVIDCARSSGKKKFFGWGEGAPGYVADYLDAETSLFIRAEAENPCEALDAAKKTFGQITLLARTAAPGRELAFITPAATERELRTKLETLHILTPLSVIRVAES